MQAITNQNEMEIKNCLKAYITADPSDLDNSIKKALKQIEIKKINVWEQHNGDSLNTNQVTWTQDYFVDLQVDLRMNFSKERFAHMLEVGKVAFPAPVEQINLSKKTISSESSKMNTSQKGTSGKKDQTLLYMGITGIAVVILTIVLVKLLKND